MSEKDPLFRCVKCGKHFQFMEQGDWVLYSLTPELLKLDPPILGYPEGNQTCHECQKKSKKIGG